ncbi:sulfurtransferase [Jongsikchunia kroppenstedtii]|uniref:sulfurtransferase n=1 Tax=Jongsikchunia kroppenstedtii TaxID=1121721 RepID=UPI00036B8F37|nr:sulfurtransferase [Jongsikchunia kroppenstedtii]
MGSVLISVDELRTLTAPVVLDVRWQLGDPDGREHYRGGHIPGAIYVDLDADLAATPTAAAGRHPLPDVADLQESVRRWGIEPDSSVVCYDDLGGQAAARAWWLLRWAGVADVRLLDGALEAWRSAGLELETGDESTPAPSSMVLTPQQLPTMTIDEVAEFDGVLLDARAGERYRGEQEPMDPRAGHIPGALSAPSGENLTADGHFRSAADLRARFTELGVAAGTPVAAYCGSGVTAAHEVAALAIAGFEAALFPGSWSQWSNNPSRLAATGPDPG